MKEIGCGPMAKFTPSVGGGRGGDKEVYEKHNITAILDSRQQINSYTLHCLFTSNILLERTYFF